MTSKYQKGRYGRYVRSAITVVDFVIVNAVYFVIACFDRTGDDFSSRMVWLLVNLSLIPVVYWFSNVHSRRAVYMDRIVINSVEAVGLHALFFLSLATFLSLDDISIKTYLWFYGACIVALPVWWISARFLLKRWRRRGLNFVNVVIVGTNETAMRLYDEMQSDSGYGYKVVGFVDAKRPDEFPEHLYAGDLTILDRYVKEHGIREIYYTLSGENKSALHTAIAVAESNVVPFYYVPQLSPYINRSVDLYSIGSVPVLTLRHNPLKITINRLIKRAFDVMFSSVVLAVLCPLVFIPVAVAVKMSSPGPVFFRQKRTGYRGKAFDCLKFRTMKVNADADSVQASEHDPRKTRVGDFLRRTSIDELPQFINVLLGQMSVVGPRPHMLKHTEDYRKIIDKYMVRHVIKPGITGWAQVNGYRGSTDELWKMEKRVQYDVWYIEHWSFFLDLKIIVRTVLNAFEGEKNAF